MDIKIKKSLIDLETFFIQGCIFDVFCSLYSVGQNHIGCELCIII